MRKWLVMGWLTCLLVAIGVIFWYNEWRYNLPTPIPVNYHAVTTGTRVHLPASAAGVAPMGGKPLFLHFFNPDCPCSRFNMPHFRSLVQEYGRQVNFVIVLMTDKSYTAGEIRDRFNLPYPIPVIKDSLVAAACGVYSTPQAVIIDTAEKLFYRGNYNRNRYCSDDKSSYARIALEGLIHHAPKQTFDPLAFKAYGCQLPTCTQ